MKKNNLKKIIAVTLTIALGSTILSGCGKKASTGEDGKITISISNFPNKDANPTLYKTMSEKVERFEATYPNIKIVGDEWEFDTQTFAAKAEGKTLPNVYAVPYTETAKIIELGYSADITKQIKEYGYYDIISDYCMENISNDGKIFFLPSSAYSMGLFLNLNLFEQAGLMESDGTPMAPKTFDELITVAQTITEKTGKAGFVMPTTENIGGWHFCVLAWNFGVKFINENNGKYTANFNTPECINALQYIKDLKWKYNTLPANTLINFNEMQKLLGTDQGAMALGNTDMIRHIATGYNMDINKIGFAQIPAGRDKHVTLVGGSYVAISPTSTPEQIDAAFKWLSFEQNVLNFTEEAKNALIKRYEDNSSLGYLIGIRDLSVWNTNSDYIKYESELIDQYCNVDINHVKLFNDKSQVGYQTEEPVCTQDLYSLLDACIQEVLTNKNANCAEILEKANSDFENNFLKYQ